MTDIKFTSVCSDEYVKLTVKQTNNGYRLFINDLELPGVLTYKVEVGDCIPQAHIVIALNEYEGASPIKITG